MLREMMHMTCVGFLSEHPLPLAVQCGLANQSAWTSSAGVAYASAGPLALVGVLIAPSYKALLNLDSLEPAIL